MPMPLSPSLFLSPPPVVRQSLFTFFSATDFSSPATLFSIEGRWALPPPETPKSPSPPLLPPSPPPLKLSSEPFPLNSSSPNTDKGEKENQREADLSREEK